MDEDMATANEGLANAGITPKERLGRIEAVLERIDQKLDGKANSSDLIALELRVRDLELHGSTAARDALIETKEIKTSLEVSHEKMGNEVSSIKTRLALYAGAIGMASFLINWYFSYGIK